MSTAVSATRFRPIAPEQYVDISNRVCSMHYETSDSSGSIASRFSGSQIGPVSLACYESYGLEHGVRTLEHVRDNVFDFFILCMPLHARFQFLHAGIRSDISNGSAVLLTSQRPFEAYVSGDSVDGLHSSLQVRLPGALLRGRVPQVDRLCNRTLSTTAGAGAVTRTTLLSLLRRSDGLSEVQGQHCARAVTDLIASCLQDAAGGAASDTGESASATDTLFDKALLFIECQLSANNLDTELVASHCRVSSRYLHTVFARRSLSVSGYIREARLQQCRRALQDPASAQQSIIEIACRWGFGDPSHFGRLYRKRFGVCPSTERSLR